MLAVSVMMARKAAKAIKWTLTSLQLSPPLASTRVARDSLGLILMAGFFLGALLVFACISCCLFFRFWVRMTLLVVQQVVTV